MADRIPAHVFETRVYWEDTDGAGIVYYNHIHTLLMSATQACTLQATGASIQKAVEIALTCECKYAGLQLEVDTFTMPCTDEQLNTEGDLE